MKRNDIRQLPTMSTNELQSKLKETRVQLEQTHRDILMGKLKNVRLVQALRKDIARIETALSAKGI